METSEKEIPEIFLVLRFGKNVFTKNGETSQFEVAEADVDAIIREFEERKRDLVIDYEHQSLNGQKAPAAGWIDRLEKTADGLQAHVRYWTEDAQKYLKSGEYRYFSPTLYFSEGKPVALHSVALTNHPALHLGRIKRTCGIAHGVIFFATTALITLDASVSVSRQVRSCFLCSSDLRFASLTASCHSLVALRISSCDFLSSSSRLFRLA